MAAEPHLLLISAGPLSVSSEISDCGTLESWHWEVDAELTPVPNLALVSQRREGLCTFDALNILASF